MNEAGSLLAYLKKASTLETILYTYDSIDENLSQRLENTDSEALQAGRYEYGDALPKREAKSTDRAIADLSTVKAEQTLFGTRYVDTQTEEYDKLPDKYRKFYTYEDWKSDKIQPPKGYPVRAEREYKAKVEQNKSRFSARGIFSFIGEAVCAILIFGLFLAVIIQFVLPILASILNLFGIELLTDWFTDLGLLNGDGPSIVPFGKVFLICVLIVFAIYTLGTILSEIKKRKPPVMDAEPLNDPDYLEVKAKYEAAVDERNEFMYRELRNRDYCLAVRPKNAEMRKRVRSILDEHYALDIVHPKYRNLVAMNQICEYIETGRCYELTGHDGAYNLYESELRANRIIAQLDKVNDNLELVKQNQYMIYTTLCSVHGMHGLLYNISEQLDKKPAGNPDADAIADFNRQVEQYIGAE